MCISNTDKKKIISLLDRASRTIQRLSDSSDSKILDLARQCAKMKNKMVKQKDDIQYEKQA
jgi:hypothetical protein